MITIPSRCAGGLTGGTIHIAGRSATTTGVLGVEHILTGIDHLLLVLALLIITGGGWRLVKTITAFTISHSLTLTAAALVPAYGIGAIAMFRVIQRTVSFLTL